MWRFALRLFKWGVTGFQSYKIRNRTATFFVERLNGENRIRGIDAAADDVVVVGRRWMELNQIGPELGCSGSRQKRDVTRARRDPLPRATTRTGQAD